MSTITCFTHKQHKEGNRLTQKKKKLKTFVHFCCDFVLLKVKHEFYQYGKTTRGKLAAQHNGSWVAVLLSSVRFQSCPGRHHPHSQTHALVLETPSLLVINITLNQILCKSHRASVFKPLHSSDQAGEPDEATRERRARNTGRHWLVSTRLPRQLPGPVEMPLSWTLHPQTHSSEAGEPGAPTDSSD